MSAGTSSLVEAVRGASPTERAAVLAELLRGEAAPGLPVVRMPAASGQSEIVFVLLDGVTPPGQPPTLTPAEEAELQRRLATLDDAVPLDEIIAEFRRLAAEPPPGS
jgi:hypothetical protein